MSMDAGNAMPLFLCSGCLLRSEQREGPCHDCGADAHRIALQNTAGLAVTVRRKLRRRQTALLPTPHAVTPERRFRFNLASRHSTFPSASLRGCSGCPL